ncbi:DUF7352 domain-containing protein [Streptomyces sparsogenes]|uniref:DUF7352 domain-containing protein n=1 Tax=Streptomyces sparsogenes DSM 40356 TaxID=1331668 RepID=A0A1R1S865_9ACTN|nr:hypothetical protein [Streptomyces sparsogenes]OMI34388.1 hypothetical protein SPAR_36431 [Streptomyces sparsogenes DSM 40356]
MTRAIHRYEVPVDDCWHAVDLTGEIVHVDSRSMHTVEIWAIHGPGEPTRRGFRVYGTGHPIPDDAIHVGTAIPPGGQLVWHLLELPETT